MGISVAKHITDLGPGLVLAPERFDPRRQVTIESDVRVSDIVNVLTENVAAGAADLRDEVLVLDTTHAYEGFVIHRHAPVSRNELGSTKRRLRPGDVIISRLRPYLRQVAYISDALFTLAPHGNDVCASTEFFVLRSKGVVEPAALLPLLLTDQVQTALAAGQEGGHHPRFAKKLLEEMSVPASVVDRAPETADQVRLMADLVRQSLDCGRALVEQAQNELT